MLELAALLVRVLLVLVVVHHASTYLLWAYEERRYGPARRPRQLPAAVMAWFGEVLAHFVALLGWPFGLLPERELDSAGYTGIPVVLVHGWGMNRASMAMLAARLRKDGRRVFRVNYPSTGPDTGVKAEHVARFMRNVLERTGAERIDVVGHSLGGVVSRVVARHHGGMDFMGALVTLGSPHRGSALVDALRWARTRQLRPGSNYLTTLADDDPVPGRVRVTAISSLFDAIVFPVANAEYDGAVNVSVDYVGHMSLVLSSRVYGLVKEALES